GKTSTFHPPPVPSQELTRTPGDGSKCYSPSKLTPRGCSRFVDRTSVRWVRPVLGFCSKRVQLTLDRLRSAEPGLGQPRNATPGPWPVGNPCERHWVRTQYRCLIVFI